MEQMGSFSDEKVLLGNQMQQELATMHGEEIEAFIDMHAEDFRRVVNSNPQLIDEYKEDPNGTLNKISESIYHH